MTALKCKDGDLAVVINDTIDCRQNLGRIVRLRGPVRVLKPSGMLGWRIKPLHPTPWGVTEINGRSVNALVTWQSCVYHEDAWLMPIRPHEVWQQTDTATAAEFTDASLFEFRFHHLVASSHGHRPRVEPRDLEPRILNREHAKEQTHPISVDQVCLGQATMSGRAAG